MTAILIPTVLRKFTAGKEQILAQGTTVRGLLQNLEEQFAGISKTLYLDSGELRPFINVYVNDEDIRFLADLDTPVKAEDVVTILPAIAGG
jgi:molybdopterin converting factor small subunit